MPINLINGLFSLRWVCMTMHNINKNKITLQHWLSLVVLCYKTLKKLLWPLMQNYDMFLIKVVKFPRNFTKTLTDITV